MGVGPTINSLPALLFFLFFWGGSENRFSSTNSALIGQAETTVDERSLPDGFPCPRGRYKFQQILNNILHGNVF